ncbi:MAG: ferredoxin family protein [Veillonella sp.]|uniref:ferredoxin family protein n=1 Tax=Veillonella sp. TaxID=1926307 RepID=UPI00257DB1F4|nr:ferredoxin family protein [Veillonella sp.]MBS5755459.1 ferredoxin family protein [Veillonella sp.]
MKLEERLGANKYYVDETCPHIIIDGESVSREEAMKLVNGCPAGLYTLQEDGTLAFDSWKYPRNAKGVEFRQG